MNTPEAVIILLLLLGGPIILAPLERNLEAYCFVLGLAAATLGSRWDRHLLTEAATMPILISVVVVVAGIAFGRGRPAFDRAFALLRARIRRPILTAITVFAIALLSSLITAIVAALMLVEAVGLLKLNGSSRVRVTIAGCFAIGLGAALTPIGEPLATLVAGALNLDFLDLFEMLALYVIPGVAAMSALAGFFARGEYSSAATIGVVHESVRSAVWQGVRVFVFIAGLVLISDAYAPLAERYVAMLGRTSLYWVNTLSAVLDNATLVALEVHHMDRGRTTEALMSLLISGGMLIQGNIPNIVSAGILKIGSAQWARTAVPIGLSMLGIYFAVFIIWI